MSQKRLERNSSHSHFEIEPLFLDEEGNEILPDSNGKNSSKISSMKQKILDSVNGYNLGTIFVATNVFSCVVLSAMAFWMLVKLFLELTDRYFVCLPLALLFWLHNVNILIVVLHDSTSKKRLFFTMMTTFIISASNIVVYGWIIPLVYHQFYSIIFQDLDGTMVWEWEPMQRQFLAAVSFGFVTAFFQGIVIILGITISAMSAINATDTKPIGFHEWYKIGTESHNNSIKNILLGAIYLSFLMSGTFLLICLFSGWTYLIPHDTVPFNYNTDQMICDPLDKTECLLPFPSNFFTIPSSETSTGLRVNIHADGLKEMFKGNGPSHPDFLNDMDGFSTLAPILFYVEGMKEANGRGIYDNLKLIGPNDDIGLSVTNQSVTLLVDVAQQLLVPHFAEIDYLDEQRPLIVLQPAAPLKHNTTYAVAVINAAASDGTTLLPQSDNLRHIFDGDNEALDKLRNGSHFRSVLFPAVKQAANPWYANISTNAIQMMFDFHTISSESQLKITRKIRDTSLHRIEDIEWKEDHNVRIVKIESNNECNGNLSTSIVARTVHMEIDVPWFLYKQQKAQRATFIKQDAFKQRGSETAPIKLVVLIPCSVARDENPLEVKAIVDYGHGFLFSREELLIPNNYLQRMANENGYILVASNWRGMSQLDLPVIIKALLADIRLFRAVSDNIIQGYGNKAVIQHFVRNSLHKMSFMKFSEKALNLTLSKQPRYLFYGVSQGGILGAAYTALLGPTNLLDGSILVSTATPFATLMTRSTLFPYYEFFLKLNIKNKRHIRIVLSIIQMILDSSEVAGLMAPPLSDPIPKTLMASALGDEIVSSIAGEIMARSFNASVVQNNPKDIFGVLTIPDNNVSIDDVNVLFTQIEYTDEYSFYPVKNIPSDKDTDVHWCVRIDPALLMQHVTFINYGKFLDPCAEDHCIREKATC